MVETSTFSTSSNEEIDTCPRDIDKFSVVSKGSHGIVSQIESRTSGMRSSWTGNINQHDRSSMEATKGTVKMRILRRGDELLPFR